MLTSPKPRSHTILRGPEQEEINPVLSVWRFGTGSAAAFTSDLSSNWGAQWVTWERYRAFVSQIISEISRTQKESDIHLQLTSAGNEGVITVEDHGETDTFLELQASVMGPNNQEKFLTLEQISPRRYRSIFPLWGPGRYQVMAAAAGTNRSDTAIDGLSVAYSPEYLQLHSNTKTLERIAMRTGRTCSQRKRNRSLRFRAHSQRDLSLDHRLVFHLVSLLDPARCRLPSCATRLLRESSPGSNARKRMKSPEPRWEHCYVAKRR